MTAYVAPAGTPAPVGEPEDPWERIALLYGVSPEQAAGFAQAMRNTGPRQELLWRLNERLQGRDPGQPNNWRGLQ